MNIDYVLLAHCLFKKVKDNNDENPIDPSIKVSFGVKIDTTNPNPETAVTYIDDTVGFTPAKMNFTTDTFEYGSWENKFPFNQIKPCVLKDGVVQYYLNPNDYTKKIDGTTADIVSGNDGDVMVEFPKIYWKFERVGTDLYIRYSNTQVDKDYKCLAHTNGTKVKDKIYISAYLGYEKDGKLRSLSSKLPVANKTISTFRTLSQSNGKGYEQVVYYQLLMLQVLYLIMFKNRNSQQALGRGYVDGNTSNATTGSTDTKGLFYGSSSGAKQIKFCGIEDFWGNYHYWIDGLYCDVNYNILISTENYNDTGIDYTNYGKGATSSVSGYISDVQGDTETGFIIKDGGGSLTTHYTDQGGLFASRVSSFGGSRSHDSSAGAFILQLNRTASASEDTISSRITYSST